MQDPNWTFMIKSRCWFRQFDISIGLCSSDSFQTCLTPPYLPTPRPSCVCTVYYQGEACPFNGGNLLLKQYQYALSASYCRHGVIYTVGTSPSRQLTSRSMRNCSRVDAVGRVLSVKCAFRNSHWYISIVFTALDKAFTPMQKPVILFNL